MFLEPEGGIVEAGLQEDVDSLSEAADRPAAQPIEQARRVGLDRFASGLPPTMNDPSIASASSLS
jgi:hypothetical protein